MLIKRIVNILKEEEMPLHIKGVILMCNRRKKEEEEEIENTK